MIVLGTSFRNHAKRRGVHTSMQISCSAYKFVMNGRIASGERERARLLEKGGVKKQILMHYFLMSNRSPTGLGAGALFTRQSRSRDDKQTNGSRERNWMGNYRVSGSLCMLMSCISPVLLLSVSLTVAIVVLSRSFGRGRGNYVEKSQSLHRCFPRCVRSLGEPCQNAPPRNHAR